MSSPVLRLAVALLLGGSVALAGGGGTPPPLVLDFRTFAQATADASGALLGVAELEGVSGRLERVTVTDVLQNDTCEDTLCEVLGWQTRLLTPERIHAAPGKVTLTLENAARSDTRAIRARLGQQVWRVDYFVTLHFSGGKTLKVMLYGQTEPNYRR